MKKKLKLYFFFIYPFYRYTILNGRDEGRSKSIVRSDDLQVCVRRRALRWRQGRHQDQP